MLIRARTIQQSFIYDANKNDSNNYTYLRNNRNRESVFKPKYFVAVQIFDVRCNLHITVALKSELCKADSRGGL